METAWFSKKDYIERQKEPDETRLPVPALIILDRHARVMVATRIDKAVELPEYVKQQFDDYHPVGFTPTAFTTLSDMNGLTKRGITYAEEHGVAPTYEGLLSLAKNRYMAYETTATGPDDRLSAAFNKLEKAQGYDALLLSVANLNGDRAPERPLWTSTAKPLKNKPRS